MLLKQAKEQGRGWGRHINLRAGVIVIKTGMKGVGYEV